MTISKSEFLGLVKAESAARKSTAVLIEKEILRNELESEVEKFLANGGKIKRLKGTEFKPLPPRSTVESNSEISNIETYNLLQWLNQGDRRHSRRAAIAKRTRITYNRLSSCLSYKYQCRLTRVEYAQIKAVMADIEKAELEWASEKAQ